MQLHTLKAAFAAEFLDIEKAARIEGARFEPFQLDFLNRAEQLVIWQKSRQVAWSFTAALDAVVDSIIYPGNPHIFVSVNLDEAKEKIRYAKAILEAIDAPARPRLKRDSQTELEFTNGSRLISHPCKPVRGKAQARVYLDEMAHYNGGLDREIYLAALPATTKGDGYMRIGSSPMGASGLFWEIYSQSMRPWPGFVRRTLPWWVIRSLCKDVQAAKLEAPTLDTAARVYKFGSDVLIGIFENMFVEDFQQEYECAEVDESVSWLSWDIIRQNQQADLLWWHAKSTDEAIVLLGKINNAIKYNRIESALCGGIDIGRKHDLSEFVILGKSTTGQLPLRMMISLDRVKYDDQERCFADIIRMLPFTKVLVDQNGIGAQLAENLQRITGSIARGVDFTNQSKELWAVGARTQAERSNVPIPQDRDFAYQLHSIRKKVSAAKHNIFDTEGNEQHHADKFWAWALAINAAGSGGVYFA